MKNACFACWLLRYTIRIMVITLYCYGVSITSTYRIHMYKLLFKDKLTVASLCAPGLLLYIYTYIH